MTRFALGIYSLSIAFSTPLGAIAQEATPPPLLARPPELPPYPRVTAPLPAKQLQEIAISHPAPEYPMEARRHHYTGKGAFHLIISIDTGEVTSVSVLSSTGDDILDHAAVKTLKKWKFRPHTLVGASVPITFSMPSKTRKP